MARPLHPSPGIQAQARPCPRQRTWKMVGTADGADAFTATGAGSRRSPRGVPAVSADGAPSLGAGQAFAACAVKPDGIAPDSGGG